MKWLKNVDCFSRPVEIRFKGKRGYSSIMGGFLTLLFFYITLKLLYNSFGVESTTKISYNNLPETYNYTQELQMIKISSNKFTKPPYKVVLNNKSLFYDAKAKKIIYIKEEFGTEACSKIFKEPNNNNNINGLNYNSFFLTDLEESYCINFNSKSVVDSSVMNITEELLHSLNNINWKSNHTFYSKYSFEIRTDYTTSRLNVQFTELDSYIFGESFNLIVNPGFKNNLKPEENQFWTTETLSFKSLSESDLLKTFNLQVSLDTAKHYTLLLTSHQNIINSGIIFEDLSVTAFLSVENLILSDLTYINKENTNKNSYRLLTLDLNFANQQVITYITTFSFSKFLINWGGLLNIVLLFLSIIASEFNKFLYEEDLINSVFLAQNCFETKRLNFKRILETNKSLDLKLSKSPSKPKNSKKKKSFSKVEVEGKKEEPVQQSVTNSIIDLLSGSLSAERGHQQLIVNSQVPPDDSNNFYNDDHYGESKDITENAGYNHNESDEPVSANNEFNTENHTFEDKEIVDKANKSTKDFGSNSGEGSSYDSKFRRNNKLTINLGEETLENDNDNCIGKSRNQYVNPLNNYNSIEEMVYASLEENNANELNNDDIDQNKYFISGKNKDRSEVKEKERETEIKHETSKSELNSQEKEKTAHQPKKGGFQTNKDNNHPLFSNTLNNNINKPKASEPIETENETETELNPSPLAPITPTRMILNKKFQIAPVKFFKNRGNLEQEDAISFNSQSNLDIHEELIKVEDNSTEENEDGNKEFYHFDQVDILGLLFCPCTKGSKALLSTHREYIKQLYELSDYYEMIGEVNMLKELRQEKLEELNSKRKLIYENK